MPCCPERPGRARPLPAARHQLRPLPVGRSSAFRVPRGPARGTESCSALSLLRGCLIIKGADRSLLRDSSVLGVHRETPIPFFKKYFERLIPKRRPLEVRFESWPAFPGDTRGTCAGQHGIAKGVGLWSPLTVAGGARSGNWQAPPPVQARVPSVAALLTPHTQERRAFHGDISSCGRQRFLRNCSVPSPGGQVWLVTCPVWDRAWRPAGAWRAKGGPTHTSWM